MSLTTMELLNTLEVGQEAKALPPMVNLRVKKDSYNSFIVVEDDYSAKYLNKPLPLTGTVLQTQWKIVKKQIKFDEAVTLLNQGIHVECEFEGSLELFQDTGDLISFKEIINGKWYKA